jgi:eukaryotic-like serine/threonine-protein kinase
MQQMVNERIGRHEVICPLGEGGMAKVYLGFSRGPANVNKLLVMKLIRSELARDKRFVTLFLDEARLATRLNHPNVVQTYEVLEDAGQYILTMEYLEGQSLFNIFQRIDLQFFPLEEHLWILTQVLAGLQYAHSLPDYNGSPLGVVHRDVSPDNTFVTYNGDVKLLDFGIAKASGAVSITNRGAFKGKLTYCAPEQLQGDEPPDARADIFSVGVMLWEALAGRRIEMGEGFAKLAQTRLEGKEPRIRNLRPDVDPALAEMCDRAMALKPADRYLTAVDLQRNLERYLEKSAKRVGRTQLAELMRGHFEIERRSMQKCIEEHLSVTRNAPAVARESPLLDVPSRERRLRLTALSETGSGAPRSLDAHTQEASSPPFVWNAQSSFFPKPIEKSVSVVSNSGLAQPKRRLNRWPLILAVTLVGVAAIAVGLWKRSPKPVASAPSFSKVTPAAASPPKVSDSTLPTPPPISVPAEAPLPDTIHLDIRVAPSEAELTLDDKPVDGNQLRAEVPKDWNIHVIRASAPGFIPFSQSVSFASDVHLDAELRRLPSPRRGTKSRPPQIGGKSSGNLIARPQPRETDQPGMNLDRPPLGWTTRQIDGRNPYSKQIDEKNPYSKKIDERNPYAP